MENRPELHRLFSDPEAFVFAANDLFTSHSKELHYFFHSPADMIDYIEQEILRLYISEDTEPQLDSKIRFCVGGALRLLLYTHSSNALRTTIDLVKRVLA